MVGNVVRRYVLIWSSTKDQKLIQWCYRIKNVLLGRVYCFHPLLARRYLEHRMARVPELTSVVGRKVSWFNKNYDGGHGMFCAADLMDGRFTFLNQTKAFKGTDITWKNAELTYLWDFNLHYFEYLHALSPFLSSGDVGLQARARKVIEGLLANWIESNLCPAMPAWHSYTTSLRIINWIKLLNNFPEFASRDVLTSLYTQLLFLERNLEGHLQVNHLLENGRALMFGGLYYASADAERWLAAGLRIARRAMNEQLLPRGGHIERSPMYHAFVLEGLLDLYAYLTAAMLDADWLRGPLLQMCRWLEQIECPDGSLPLFNDAAEGISASAAQILENARRMIGYEPLQENGKVRNCDDFFVFADDPLHCAIDGAPIGPSYNPGHAHSDNFTFELFFNGKRLVVDSGTYNYDKDEVRQLYRSTRSHNTLVINGFEQSEVWSGFRVGRRSNPHISTAFLCDGCCVYFGEYINRLSGSQRINHARLIVQRGGEWLLVWDLVRARGPIEAMSFCHIAPGWQVGQEDGFIGLKHQYGDLVRCYPLEMDGIAIEKGHYSPEFGDKQEIPVLSFAANGNLQRQMGYLVSARPFSTNPVVHPLHNGRLRIKLDNHEYNISIDGVS